MYQLENLIFRGRPDALRDRTPDLRPEVRASGLNGQIYVLCLYFRKRNQWQILYWQH